MSEPANIDWENLGFRYMKTDFRYISKWKDGDWDQLTWSEYRDEVHRAAAGLQALGVGLAELSAAVREQVEIACRYEGYIAKQANQVERARRLEGWALPEDWDYAGLTGLRLEAREQLARHRPSTVGQAARLQGVNPADISVLLVELERYQRRSGAEARD